MLSGLMMQVAMQLGLHRPVQPEEFTTFRMEVRGEELKDRLQTWVICNIVAQKYVFISSLMSYFPNDRLVLLLDTASHQAQSTIGHLSLPLSRPQTTVYRMS
jgi:hypothetical protein